MEEDSVEKYLLKHHKANIIQILQDADVRKHFSININFVELFETDTNLGNSILKNTEEALDELDQWIFDVQYTLLETLNDGGFQEKPNIHARVYGLPAFPELNRTIFPKNEDLDLFLQVSGTVTRITTPKMLEFQRSYLCTKCKYVEMVEAVYDQKYLINPPRRCTNPDKCTSTNLISENDLSVDNCRDYQEIKIQEEASKLGVGTMPASMWVTLEDDLVDSCKPGDDVTICGIVKRRWGPLVPGKFIDVQLTLKANHIQVNNGHTSPGLITPEVREQFTTFWEKHQKYPLEGRDFILKSFCPKLYGMYLVKLAVAMVLAGGSHCTQGNEVGITIRSEPHILLVGDPGTGKSQLLRYAAKVIPRSVLTTGVGTTSAGLTVAAVMEEGQWQLEGGALVLADGGICCIDEFNSMKPQDRTSIHEAMEQQTISVAKASMVCKLRTRCSILAATNPKGGHLDPSQPLSLNLALPSPLLSRFDIVLMLKDCYDSKWDNLVCDYIFKRKQPNEIKVDEGLWNLEMLQQYFSIIRNLNPMLTHQAHKILGSYYQAQRRTVTRNKARTTTRLLDSLVRLSQAHARLMFHTKVHVMDAIFAVMLIESSMNGECTVLSLDSINLQAPFDDAPMENYAQLAKTVLGKLGLEDILKNEFMYLSNGCKYNQDSTCSDDQNSESVLSFFKNCGHSTSIESNDSVVVTDLTLESLEETRLQDIETIVTDVEGIKDDVKQQVKESNDKNKPKALNKILLPESKETRPQDTELVITYDNGTKNDVKQQNTEIGNKNKPKALNKVVKSNPIDISSEPPKESCPEDFDGTKNDLKQQNTKKGYKNKPKVIKVDAATEIEKPSCSNTDYEKKKRKNVTPHASSKHPKPAKDTSILNDFQMLNLIPSVNDDFDEGLLDFEENESATFKSHIDSKNIVKEDNILVSTVDGSSKDIPKVATEDDMAVRVKKNLSKFYFKPRNLVEKLDNTCETKTKAMKNCDKSIKKNDEGVLDFEDESATFKKHINPIDLKNIVKENNILVSTIDGGNKDIPKVATEDDMAVRVKKKLSKFYFKPRNLDEKPDNTNETKAKAAENCDKSIKKIDHTQSSVGMFDNEDLDLVNFDL